MTIPDLSNPLIIDEFIEPHEEQINNDSEDIMEAKINNHSRVEDNEESPSEEPEKEVEIISHTCYSVIEIAQTVWITAGSRGKVEYSGSRKD